MTVRSAQPRFKLDPATAPDDVVSELLRQAGSAVAEVRETLGEECCPVGLVLAREDLRARASALRAQAWDAGAGTSVGGVVPLKWRHDDSEWSLHEDIGPGVDPRLLLADVWETLAEFMSPEQVVSVESGGS